MKLSDTTLDQFINYTPEEQLVFAIKQKIKKGKTKNQIIKALLDTIDTNGLSEQELKTYTDQTLDLVNTIYAIQQLE